MQSYLVTKWKWVKNLCARIRILGNMIKPHMTSMVWSSFPSIKRVEISAFHTARCLMLAAEFADTAFKRDKWPGTSLYKANSWVILFARFRVALLSVLKHVLSKRKACSEWKIGVCAVVYHHNLSHCNVKYIWGYYFAWNVMRITKDKNERVHFMDSKNSAEDSCDKRSGLLGLQIYFCFLCHCGNMTHKAHLCVNLHWLGEWNCAYVKRVRLNLKKTT